MKIPARAQSLADRAVMTAAQSSLAYLGSTVALDALSLNWVVLGGVALGGALASLLTNLARGGITGRATKED
jgi:hypothetical protein